MKVINFLGNRIGSGGIESFVTNMSEGMKDNGVEYIVCANCRTKNIYGNRLNSNGAEVIYFREKPVSYFCKLCDFTKYMKKNRNAILYLHASTPGMYLHAFLAKKVGVKKIAYHVHSTPDNRIEKLKMLKDACLKKMFSDIPLVNIACSKDAGEAFYKNQRYTIVHNGIQVDRFRYSPFLRELTRKELGINDELVLLQVGRFSLQKNQFFTLSLFKECIEKGMHVKLILVGEGQYETSMREYIKENSLEKHVCIIAPDANVERYYMAADLLMFPSEFEGLGIVALEAQTAGLPVLASSCIVDEICFTDFIERIDLESTDVWLRKIQLCMESKMDRKELSRIGYSGCVKNGFSIENGREELLKIYGYMEGCDQPENPIGECKNRCR